MARAEASCIIRSAITRTQTVQAPVWPRIAPDQPVRHSARQRRPYRPRGVVRAESLALWGAQDTSTPQRAFVAASPRVSPRKRLVAAGVASAIAGTIVLVLPTSDTPQPSVAVQPPVMVTPLRPAPMILRVEPAMPVTRSVFAQPAVQPVPRVQDDAPTIAMQSPLFAASAAPRIATPVRPVSARPAMAEPALATGAFRCADCTSSTLRLDGITVTLHGAGATQARAADTITAMGGEVLSRRQATISVTRSQIRFYRAQDVATAQSLANRFDAVLVDVTWLSETAPARFDLLLAQDAPLPN